MCQWIQRVNDTFGDPQCGHIDTFGGPKPGHIDIFRVSYFGHSGQACGIDFFLYEAEIEEKYLFTMFSLLRRPKCITF